MFRNATSAGRCVWPKVVARIVSAVSMAMPTPIHRDPDVCRRETIA
jgi:hypothetical protein